MIQPYTPEKVVEKVPINWSGVMVYVGIFLFIAFIITEIIIRRKKFKKKHNEWFEVAPYLTKRHIYDDTKYISMPFKQFHEYYSLNPDRYDLHTAKVLVRNMNEEEPKTSFKTRYTHTIIFSFKEYKKYRAWVEKSTNGMHDARCINNTLDYLTLVQADIQAIRDREAVAVSESQKTMQEVMERIQEAVDKEDLPEEHIIDIRKKLPEEEWNIYT